MAQLLSSSAPPRLHLAATPGHGVSRLSVTSACSAAPGSLVSMRRQKARSLTVRCEQGAKGGGGGGGLDVWLSRGAMIGFVAAITVELTTGKGVLQNVGLTSPVPTVALALTGVVGVATAFLIFQSASKD
ncbi:stress enhanced protein 1, chloroplastic-like isoform X2 [Oryza glaberrima]|uniref:stress enhanced protein 1, chloroplastic-like isoform X2 n=1 Tax=Oryza glaberrima TaxID=4538 RepID=UPI00224C321C|nr:stress enhanced protein 1, chloroplastic-like isoform X2 [Oryza glaberrima]